MSYASDSPIVLGVRAPHLSDRAARPIARWCGLVLAVAAASGCEQREDLRQYTVDKPPPPAKAPLPKVGQPTESAGMSLPARTDRPTDRTLGALIPQPDQIWFVKLSGALEATRGHVESFLEFVRSLRFEQGQPHWRLPEGWSVAENPSGTGRYATLIIHDASGAGESRPLLEVTVTSLPSPPDDLERYLLKNVNRWRGQLGQPDLQPDEFAEQTVEIKLASGPRAWLVNLQGWKPGAPAAAGPSRGAAASPRLPFAYSVPEGWEPGELNAFRLAAWTVRDRDEAVTITVSTAGGNLAQNINRWREQIGLERLDEEAVRSSIETIPMGSATGSYVKLPAPEGAGEPKTILGAIVPAGETTWFFKLQGDSRLADREQPKFEAFLKSISYP